jgi:hypothetical protein
LDKIKTLLTQKTTWAGIGLIVNGVGQYVIDQDINKLIQSVLAGLGLIFMRQAVAKQGA